jgi:hypothetical protein
MPLREGDSKPAVALQAFAGQVFFHSYRRTIADHLAGAGRATFADRIARADLRRQIRSHEQGLPARRDSGYRQLLSRLVAQKEFPACVHASMGPRPLVVLAWDPQLRRVCTSCHSDHTNAVSAFDSEDHCDGCQRTRPDVALSWAVDEKALLIMHAGLCASCRADLPADPLARG